MKKIVSLYCFFFFNVLACEEGKLMLDFHTSSNDDPMLRKYYEHVISKSSPHCVIRLYTDLPDRDNNCSSVVYSIHESQDGTYYGMKMQMTPYALKGYGSSISYFIVEEKIIDLYHSKFTNLIKNKNFLIKKYPSIDLELGFSIIMDIRYSVKGDNMLRFIKNIHYGKEKENEFYQYVLNASKTTTPKKAKVKINK